MIEIKLMDGGYRAFFFGLHGPIESQIRMTVEPMQARVELMEQILNQESFWSYQQLNLFQTGQELVRLTWPAEEDFSAL